MIKGACLSECLDYRYALWRIWDEDKPLLTFVMLNPSTANAEADDSTVKRCMRFAGANGFGGMIVANLFAYRATKPRDMLRAADPIGPLNDEWLLWISRYSHTVVCAWGVDGKRLDRDRRVMSLLPNSFCLDVTKEGYPKHPLYVAARTKFKPYSL